jgi:ferrous iron transport protein A
MNIDTLNNLSLDESALILENNIKRKNKKHLTNLGLTSNNKIKCLYKSPLGDPTAYMIKNVIIAIREEDSKNILILRGNNGSY